MDAYSAEYLYNQLCRYYGKNNCKGGCFSVALIGHPKLITDKYLENMKKLIQMIKGNTKFRLCNINEAYEKLQSK